MTTEEIDLELREAIGGNGDLGELAKAGRDAIRNGVPRDEVFDNSASYARALTRRRRQFHARFARGHGENVFDS